MYSIVVSLTILLIPTIVALDPRTADAPAWILPVQGPSGPSPPLPEGVHPPAPPVPGPDADIAPSPADDDTVPSSADDIVPSSSDIDLAYRYIDMLSRYENETQPNGDTGVEAIAPPDGIALAEAIAPAATTYDSTKPFGPYYCQARCVASCLDTYQTRDTENCQTMCPALETGQPCAVNDEQCWRTCGSNATDENASPQSPYLVPSEDAEQNSEPDPFLIQLAWYAVPNVSLYIVEFYPLNRVAKEGENNFFRALTTSLSYSVRKDDECIEYDARVIAVNSQGISEPAYLHIPAPTPVMMYGGDHFSVRTIQRDPEDPKLVTVTVDYTVPSEWPMDHVDMGPISVTATECKGPLSNRTFGGLNTTSDILIPESTVLIGKVPTPDILISFSDDILQSDCLFKMRVQSIKSRCNSVMSYEDIPDMAPGIDFRINCNVISGGCGNDTVTVAQPVPPTDSDKESPAAAPVVINPPAFLPPGIAPLDNANGTSEDIPTPPLLPLDFFGESNVAPQAQAPSSPVAGPPGVINIGNKNAAVPPNCQMEILDVQPSLSYLSPSLLDVQVNWLERQPRGFQLPLYFTVRYGPILRQLVQGSHEQSEIIGGYETILRTGQQSTHDFIEGLNRQVNITGLQRQSLYKIQVCAIYDKNSEPMIQWQSVSSYRIDLAVLEPFLEVESGAQDVISTTGRPMAVGSQISMNDVADVPLYIGIEEKPSQDTVTIIRWILFLAIATLVMLAFIFIFLCLRITRPSREKQVVFVTGTPSISMNDVAKVPLP